MDDDLDGLLDLQFELQEDHAVDLEGGHRLRDSPSCATCNLQRRQLDCGAEFERPAKRPLQEIPQNIKDGSLERAAGELRSPHPSLLHGCSSPALTADGSHLQASGPGRTQRLMPRMKSSLHWPLRQPQGRRPRRAQTPQNPAQQAAPSRARTSLQTTPMLLLLCSLQNRQWRRLC